MDEESRRDTVSDGCEHEKKCRNHRLRIYPSCAICKGHLAARNGERGQASRGLFLISGRERARQPCFAAIRGVAMDDSTLSRFVDRRDEGLDLAAIRLFRRTRALLQSTKIG